MSTPKIIETYIHPSQLTQASGNSNSNRVAIIFPEYRVAMLLFENYLTNVDHMCRILHVPSVRSLIRTIYLMIGQGAFIPPSQAALLLAIFALSSFFYQSYDNSEVASTEHEAVELSKFWSRYTLDVLSHSTRSTPGSLEDIQAFIVMTYVTKHLIGPSSRDLLLSTTAASIARNLRLHRLDSNDESLIESAISPRDLIDREVKRRVFWHIVTTDW
jgi:hypothetical protein